MVPTARALMAWIPAWCAALSAGASYFITQTALAVGAALFVTAVAVSARGTLWKQQQQQQKIIEKKYQETATANLFEASLAMLFDCIFRFPAAAVFKYSNHYLPAFPLFSISIFVYLRILYTFQFLLVCLCLFTTPLSPLPPPPPLLTPSLSLFPSC